MVTPPAPRATAKERLEFGRLLRADIIAARYAPNERLVEAELAEKYGVRRGVVRVVLAELVHEGLVVRSVNRGARVRVVTTEEAVEISEARLAMDAICAAKAAERATDQQLVDLKSILERAIQAVDVTDILGFNEALHELHHYIRVFSKHTVGMRVAEQLRNQSIRYQFGEMMLVGRMPMALQEHIDIVESIMARDPKAAQEAVHRHSDGFVRAIIAMKERTATATVPGNN